MEAQRRTTRPSSGASARAFLASAGTPKTIARYARGDVVFAQGDTCKHVLYIKTGGIRLSVLSKTGRKAVVATLRPGAFFGEGCLAGQPYRIGSATATAPSTILLVRKEKMLALLRQQHAMSDKFIAHLLARNIRIEGDLIDQLFNSSEKRLARTLLVMARYGQRDEPIRVVPRISEDTLAGMVGITCARVHFFLKKFRMLGFIECKGDLPLTVNSSLLNVVLHD